MAKVTFVQDFNLGGSILAAGTELDVDLALARILVGDGHARWAASPVPLKLLRNRGVELPVEYDAETLDDVRSLSLQDTPVGTMVDVTLAGETVPRRYRVSLRNGAIPDGNAIIQPADYDAAANDKFFLRIA